MAFSINGGVSFSSSPKERSEGFQWLLSFFALCLDKQRNNSNEIFLIDEPALHLHPKGQKDVLKIIEVLSKSHQIIYSTHSPFLISKNFPQRIRLLLKDEIQGTLVKNKPYSQDNCRFWEPLKSALEEQPWRHDFIRGIKSNS